MDVATVLVLLLGLVVGAAVVGLATRARLRQRDAFQALAAEALRQNNQSFLDLARTSLGEFQKGATADLEGRQKAINEVLTNMDGKLQAIEKERHGHYERLTEQLKAVGAAHEKLHAETTNLVRALRTPSVRGRWG
ncbi:MAG: DNA recombination protein RmuC, partial [Myxococcales bacterium]|nr:DNA recombination protein RmuC [Myxococcales bacterium]